MARPKRIDIWKFDVDGVEVHVNVMMHVGDKTVFLVKHEQYFVNERDENLDVLKKKVLAHLKNHIKVTWEPYYYVRFKGEVDIQSKGALEFAKGRATEVELELMYERVDIGTKPDGSTCWRSFHGSSWGEMIHNHAIDLGLGAGPWGRTPQCAIVPATPENKAALDELAKMFKTLSTKLYEFLAPEQIQASLGQASSLLALTDARPKKPRRKPIVK